MHRYFLIFLLVTTACDRHSQSGQESEARDVIRKIEMNLSAFGVESDDFPSIQATVDILNDSSVCIKTFYNPSYPDSIYKLSRLEMDQIVKLLRLSDIRNLKKEYTVAKTDQPRSITTFITNTEEFTIDDYGLVGEYPLQKLYEIVYKY